MQHCIATAGKFVFSKVIRSKKNNPLRQLCRYDLYKLRRKAYYGVYGDTVVATQNSSLNLLLKSKLWKNNVISSLHLEIRKFTVLFSKLMSLNNKIVAKQKQLIGNPLKD